MATRNSTRRGSRPEHAAFMKAYWTPERRQAHSERITQRWQDLDYRRAQSEHVKQRWQNPDYRRAKLESLSASMKARWKADRDRELMFVRKFWKTLSPEAKKQRATHLRTYPAASGARHGNWKGGRYIRRDGYVLVRVDSGGYLLEHRVIAARVMGRPLKPHEVVHHRNGRRDDNRSENMIICTAGYHSWLERQAEWRNNPEKVSRDRRKAQLASTAARVRNRTRQ
jgi:HNH endonuclease